MVGVTMLQTISIGAGGGSIASLNQLMSNQIQVGPRSAGSVPGPACYNLGGTEPTVTDADLVLGYINPETYFGGRMQLDKAKAERAIKDKIATPLGISVVEAAALIRRIVDNNMASAIKREVHLRGYKPEDFVIFAFGGAGPTHVAGFKQDVPKAVVFPSSPVFCAMGSSIMDIVHMYEVSRRMIFMEAMSERMVIDHDGFNRTVESLMTAAKQDLLAEGLDPEKARYGLELDMLYGGQVNVKRMSSPLLFIRSEADAKAVYDAFEREFSESFSPLVVNRPGGVYLDSFVLRVTVPTEKPPLEHHSLGKSNSQHAMSGARQAYWPELHEFTETPVYSFEMLQPGNVVQGPAVIDAELTTVVIPPGQHFSVDQHGLGILENSGEATSRRKAASRATERA
jgi:acetophenone carboxylase